MKEKILKILPVLILIFLTGNIIGLKARTDEVSDKLVRFHIVADSNSEEDQSVKWEVRRKIFEDIDMKNINSKEQALEYFVSEKENIEHIAEKVLKENGKKYGCKVYIGKKYFPVREYKSFVLPAGVYDTISVALGSGRGENFFCVMYPSLCAVSSISERTDENPKLLNGVLTEEEVKSVTDTGRKTVIKFKIAEMVGKIMSN